MRHPYKKKPPISRFLERIQVQEIPHPVLGTPCWLWIGAAKDNGYATFCTDRANRINVYVHRFAYDLWVGSIPDGLQVDHQCHNLSDCDAGSACPHRRCVNPDHLRSTTSHENGISGRQGDVSAFNPTPETYNNRLSRTHCPRGHRYLPTTSVFYDRGRTVFRSCVVCGVLRTWSKRPLPQEAMVRRFVRRFDSCCDSVVEVVV